MSSYGRGKRRIGPSVVRRNGARSTNGWLSARTINHFSVVKLCGLIMGVLLIMSGCAETPGAPGATEGEVNYEGLLTVPNRRFALVQLRPETDFSRYTGVLFDAPELAYVTPDRLRKEVALTREQKISFREFVDEVFTAELEQMESPGLVAEAGPEAIRLDVRLQDIRAMLQPRSGGTIGWPSIALRAVGEVTLVIEIHDSESNEILARVVDTRPVEGIAIAKDGGWLTRFQDVERIVQRWASRTRQGLEATVAGR